MAAFPGNLFRTLSWQTVRQSGFSGSQVWCGSAAGLPVYALKACPIPIADLLLRRQLMQAARVDGQLSFIPLTRPTTQHQLLLSAHGFQWSLFSWQPGEANYFREPSIAKLLAAIRALAELHQYLKRSMSLRGPCPGIRQRYAILNQPIPPASDFAATEPAIRQLLLQLIPLIRSVTPELIASLRRYLDQETELQYCLCDIWHDHLLFTGDVVTGLIDFDELKLNSVAVDLARMLGDLEPEGGPCWSSALAVYEDQTRGSIDPVQLWLLHQTGWVCSVRHWMAQAVEGRIPALLAPRVAQRLARFAIHLPRILARRHW